ncbi:hypothetical protein [Streptomyces sp. 900116325]
MIDAPEAEYTEVWTATPVVLRDVLAPSKLLRCRVAIAVCQNGDAARSDINIYPVAAAAPDVPDIHSETGCTSIIAVMNARDSNDREHLSADAVTVTEGPTSEDAG